MSALGISQLLMLLFPDVTVTWVFITTAFLSCLQTSTMSGCSAVTQLSVWIQKSHSILGLPFSTTLGGVSHFNCGTPRPYLALVFLYTIMATRLQHSISGCYILLLCWTVLGASLYIFPCIVWSLEVIGFYLLVWQEQFYTE